MEIQDRSRKLCSSGSNCLRPYPRWRQLQVLQRAWVFNLPCRFSFSLRRGRGVFLKKMESRWTFRCRHAHTSLVRKQSALKTAGGYEGTGKTHRMTSRRPKHAQTGVGSLFSQLHLAKNKQTWDGGISSMLLRACTLVHTQVSFSFFFKATDFHSKSRVPTSLSALRFS